MFIVKKDLEIKLSEALVKRFIVKTLGVIEKDFPVWYNEKTEEERWHFIKYMIDFAKMNHIITESNIQKLIYWKIEYDYTIPLSKFRESKLNRENFDEQYRMDQFFENITSGNELKKITLDSNIEEIRQ